MATKKNPKFVFVVGGVLSGVGKGITTASLGAIFRAKGLRVTAMKADPYVNVDAGTMNPTEHGEVFVTNDADETDQDMGNYERFLDVDLTSTNYMTTGRIYQSVIEDERAMKFEGKCVQVVPHIPQEILGRIKAAQELHSADITIMEIGGTVGEYENILFLEAVRELKLKQPEGVAVVLVSYLPVPSHIGEMKTKPTQHAQRQLNKTGLHADIIVARGPMELDEVRKEKLALHCGVKKENAISAPDVKSIYEVPLRFESQDIGNKILACLDMSPIDTDLSQWEDLNKKITDTKEEVKIAVVGKYFGTGDYTLADSYISVIEAIRHAAWHNDVQPKLEWVDSEQFEGGKDKLEMLKEFDGIVVPGGFGTRGIEGIINTVQYARENKIPYLGLCYGMQLACVEFVRNVLGKEEAHTVEVDDASTHPVIHVNPNQLNNIKENRYGGTMRLGAFDCKLAEGSKARAAYGEEVVSERHRHRYEFNNEYRDIMEEAGLNVVGINPESDLVEIVELADHPFFVGVQFHPEFLSRPFRPHPLFREFIKVAIS